MAGKSVNRKDNDRKHQISLYQSIMSGSGQEKETGSLKSSEALTSWRHSRRDSTNNDSVMMTFRMVEQDAQYQDGNQTWRNKSSCQVGIDRKE
jgi:hypothetical protein